MAISMPVVSALPSIGLGQITPDVANQVRAGVENRIEALTILGGDFGFSDGVFRSHGQMDPLDSNADVKDEVTKFGGSGDVGDPQPLGELGISWQPRLQGNMGYLDSKYEYGAGLLAGDTSKATTSAIEFGGGARFWFGDSFSVAPTLMGLYGHTSDDYEARSTFMRENLVPATQLGLVDWSINTWTLRPALDIQYLIRYGRNTLTLSSDSTYFHTVGFGGSNVNVRVNGNSGSIDNKIDLDVPLGIQLFGHELHTGGYLSRTELLGDLQDGLGVAHMNEVHARLVLDVLHQLWKVQWIGLGASYIDGTNISGWTVGVDVAFRF
jgi:Solitary outer membrane autotransporter beta-barrel domain